MSTAPAEVAPESESLPDQSGPRPKATSDREPPPTMRRLWVIVAIAATVAGLILALALRNRHTGHGSVSVSIRDNSLQILRLKGTTEAVQSRSLLAPILSGQQVSSLTLIRLAPGGTHVKAGDLLAEFDRQAQIRDFMDKQAEYSKLVDQVAEEQAKEVAARAKDETELTQAEDDLRKAELEIQKAEIVSKIDAEKNQETLQEARATYDQLRETFDLKRKAALAAIRILEIQRDRTQQTMLHAQSNADLMQIRSPIDGVVVLNTIWKQGTMGEVQEGDQLEPGTTFMQVVNPAVMQVRVQANQQDFPRLQVGQVGKVRLDAYPELVFPAKIEQIAPIGEAGSFSDKLRAFAVIVSIEGNNPKLMPDLSAAFDVDMSSSANGSTSAKAAAGGS
jgi:HlyD family secretion protein